MSEWVPVEKELPEEHERVLVTDADGEVYIAEWSKGYDGRIRWWGPDFELFTEAWMPLPEPYKASPTEVEGSEE